MDDRKKNPDCRQKNALELPTLHAYRRYFGNKKTQKDSFNKN